jgi:hypothetical protein
MGVFPAGVTALTFQGYFELHMPTHWDCKQILRQERAKCDDERETGGEE